jgi:hypothetical protein
MDLREPGIAPIGVLNVCKAILGQTSAQALIHWMHAVGNTHCSSNASGPSNDCVTERARLQLKVNINTSIARFGPRGSSAR